MDSKIKKETIEWLKDRAACGESQRAQTILDYIFELEEKATKYNELKVLSEISSMCIGDIAMGYTLDAQVVGEMIYDATGMTSPDLSEHVKGLGTKCR